MAKNRPPRDYDDLQDGTAAAWSDSAVLDSLIEEMIGESGRPALPAGAQPQSR